MEIRRFPATYLLLAINTLFLAWMLLRFGSQYDNGLAVFLAGGTSGIQIAANPSEWWRLLTANFIHIGLQHFAMNMVTLYFLGRQIESLYGWLQTLVIYLLAGFLGNAAVAALEPQTVAAGASASLFGMFAVMVVLRFVSQDPYIRELGRSYTVLLVLNIVFSLMPGISLLAHLGGAVGGALCAVFLTNLREGSFKWPYQLLGFAAYLSIVSFLLYQILNG